MDLPTATDLRAFVHGTLCRKADFDDSTPMFESFVQRAGRRCGVEFVLSAPRAVRLSAVWAAEENRVLFYDSEAQRFAVTAIRGPELSEYALPEAKPAFALAAWRGK